MTHELKTETNDLNTTGCQGTEIHQLRVMNWGIKRTTSAATSSKALRTSANELDNRTNCSPANDSQGTESHLETVMNWSVKWTAPQQPTLKSQEPLEPLQTNAQAEEQNKLFHTKQLQKN